MASMKDSAAQSAGSRVVARRLLYIATLVARTAAAEMRHARPPVAPAQIAVLAQHAARPSIMIELARAHAVGLPTISKSVDMLVRRGWVDRQEGKQDRRKTVVRLTPRGRRALATGRQRAERRVTE